MEKIKLLILLLFITLIGFSQNVDPETFSVIVDSTSATGKKVYSNTGGEGAIVVDSIPKWFRMPAINGLSFDDGYKLGGVLDRETLINQSTHGFELNLGEFYICQGYNYFLSNLTGDSTHVSGLIFNDTTENKRVYIIGTIDNFVDDPQTGYIVFDFNSRTFYKLTNDVGAGYNMGSISFDDYHGVALGLNEGRAIFGYQTSPGVLTNVFRATEEGTYMGSTLSDSTKLIITPNEISLTTTGQEALINTDILSSDQTFTFPDASGVLKVSTSPRVVISSDITVLPEDQFILYTFINGGGNTVSLPSTIPYNGWEITIKDGEGVAGTDNLTINVSGATETIDNATSTSITTNYGSVTIVGFIGYGYYVTKN